MKAKVISKQSEHFGRICHVVEVLHNRIFCLYIEGRKVDFGKSEIQIVADAAAGKEIAFAFQKYDSSILRSSHVRKIAKLAALAWDQKISHCEKALHAYA